MGQGYILTKSFLVPDRGLGSPAAAASFLPAGSSCGSLCTHAFLFLFHRSFSFQVKGVPLWCALSVAFACLTSPGDHPHRVGGTAPTGGRTVLSQVYARMEDKVVFILLQQRWNA